MKHWTLAVDAPWNEQGGGKIKRGADRHYPLLKSNDDIKTVLEGSGLWPDLEEGDTASLWLWATANFLDDAIRLCGMLGFEYVTNAVWVKAAFTEDRDRTPHGIVYPQAPGLGQRLRMCHEHLLYARAGKVPSPPPANRMPSVIYAPRSRHSAKPDEAFTLMEMHDSGVVSQLEGRVTAVCEWERLEFFARGPREYWDVWGNEVPQ